jgi:hypothetical protein
LRFVDLLPEFFAWIHVEESIECGIGLDILHINIITGVQLPGQLAGRSIGHSFHQKAGLASGCPLGKLLNGLSNN